MLGLWINNNVKLQQRAITKEEQEMVRLFFTETGYDDTVIELSLNAYCIFCTLDKGYDDTVIELSRKEEQNSAPMHTYKILYLYKSVYKLIT